MEESKGCLFSGVLETWISSAFWLVLAVKTPVPEPLSQAPEVPPTLAGNLLKILVILSSVKIYLNK